MKERHTEFFWKETCRIPCGTMNADDSPRGMRMQNDFHFKCCGVELRAIGSLAILAAIIAMVLIFSPVRAVLF